MAQNPIITFEMENGDIMKAELYPQVAPNTVNNFISLVNKGFYDGLIFHRVINGFMIQGGDPEGTGMGGPGYGIKGEFAQNEYEGSGTQYYPDGTMHYKGAFSGNLYEGTGKLYRENGTLSYDGEFARGMKEGTGKLYAAGDKPVYEGSFSKDQLVYSALLGKSTAEVAQAYTGSRVIYRNDSDFTVLMPDIQALYIGVTDEANLEEQVMVDSVYVLKDSILIGDQECTTIKDLKAAFGEIVYEGNSIVTLPEAVAINYLNTKKQTMNGSVELETTDEYTDVITVNRIQDDYPVYLYSFRKDGLLYTFVCKDKNDTFSFYSIMSEEGAE